jgi:hypothetical protein
MGSNPRSGGSEFTFIFAWTNESDHEVAINVASSLVLNGTCWAHAIGGVFSGDTSGIGLGFRLDVLRAFGWGNDPATGNGTLDGRFHRNQAFVAIEADGSGGHLLGGGAASAGQVFSFSPFNLKDDMIVVPARAQAVFEIVLNIDYHADDNISDEVEIDFADNERGFLVLCPFVQLEVFGAGTAVS